MTNQPLTEQQLAGIEAIADRVADDPFYVSDCEGSLQVWRESALTHVRRDEHGEIDMYSFPSTYKATDQIIELDLSTWDPGEDETDDKQRQDVYDLVESRAAVPLLLAEIRRLRAELATERENYAAYRSGAEGAKQMLTNRLNAVTDLCDEQALAARAFEVPVPEWIGVVRRAVDPLAPAAAQQPKEA
jgi:hypothetical protein